MLTHPLAVCALSVLSIATGLGIPGGQRVAADEPVSRVTVKGHTDLVHSVAFSADGKTLASGGWDLTARIWAVDSGELKATFQGHTEPVNSVAFSADGKTLATASIDRTVKVWDVADKKERLTLRGARARLYGVAFSPDGTTLASSSYDGTVKLWDVATGNERANAERSRRARVFRGVRPRGQGHRFGRTRFDREALGGQIRKGARDLTGALPLRLVPRVLTGRQSTGVREWLLERTAGTTRRRVRGRRSESVGFGDAQGNVFREVFHRSRVVCGLRRGFQGPGRLRPGLDGKTLGLRNRQTAGYAQRPHGQGPLRGLLRQRPNAGVRGSRCDDQTVGRPAFQDDQ